NLKKYKLNDNNEFVSEHNDVPILDNDGYVIETARSSWSSADDGPYVAQGGMGEKLLDNGARNIIYDDASGTNGFKEFNTTNLTIGDFDFITTAAGLTAHVDEIRMTAETSANDGWKLYDLNHSKPAMASYGTDKYLFVGSNGGMLHCVDDSDGEEVWAFIPSAQFDRSDEVYETGNHYHFMDGSPTVADVDPDINNLPDLVICGERRGGKNYYAIDITSIAAPKFEYTYTVSGQSWKKPDFIEYKESVGSAPTKSFLLTGGYDLRYDNSDDLLAEVSAINTDADATNDVAEVAGGEVVIINADGTHIATFDNTDSGLSDMGASIVSAWGVDLVEDDNDAITQIYAADLEGHIFGLKDSDLDGSWQGNHLFEVTGALVGKKIFSEVDFVREFMHVYNNVTDSWDQVVGDFVYFGTGDRADPLDNQGNDKTNYFYCVKNDWTTTDITTAGTVGSFGTLDEDEAGTSTDLVMVDVSDMNISEGDTVPDSLKASYNRGWYFELEDAGEKCLSTPLVYAGVVYFATYTPPADMGGVVDPCGTSMVGGTARIYAVDYKTGGAIYNFNLTDPNLTKEDRSTTIDAKNITIAPDPVLIITDSGDKLFIGPQEINIKSPNNGVNSFYWLPL
ncbi:MAG: hypothetical protein GY707_13435, partial [Desulfobacteraceae bacterium]|nr:hypothetical protein [Desulfobacteraceae bacterium]